MSAIDGMNTVREFIDTFDAPRCPLFWSKLIKEEFDEVCEAAKVCLDANTPENRAALLKERADLAYVCFGFAVIIQGSLVDLAPEAIKSIQAIHKVSDEVAPATTEVLHEAFWRVHDSNMSKLGDDGKPVRREDGKIMKGPNYKPPCLLDLVA
jgi:hypothetical protein